MRSDEIPPRRLLVVVAAALLGLVTAGCTTEPEADTSAETTSSSSTSEARTSAGTDTTLSATAAEMVSGAVDSLVEAGVYSFEAKLLISLQEEPTEVEVEGWVDGSDRQLAMRIEQQTVVTRVIDGVATVERNGETVEVPLAEADSAPSILILKSIQDPAFQNDSTITGELDASALTAADFDVEGSAAITVSLTASGDLAGYEMEAADGSWTVEVKFEDIGEEPNR